MKKYIAIVPARRGSKGFPNKNVMILDGETLISRAANLASFNKLISHTFIFTDYLKDEIGKISADIEFLPRSSYSCTDESVATDVIKDFLSKVEVYGFSPMDVIIYMQPTSPRRTSAHLDQVIALTKLNPNSQVISVNDVPISRLKLLTLSGDGLLLGGAAEDDLTSNRSKSKSYLPNGAFYTFEIGRFLELGCFPINGATPFFMSSHDSIDIDSENDWNELLRDPR
jgi:CMP-N,N'-diacetyllegionaminic acid synthase